MKQTSISAKEYLALISKKKPTIKSTRSPKKIKVSILQEVASTSIKKRTAKVFPTKPTTTESQVIKSVLSYLAVLQANGIVHDFWRNNTGSILIEEKRFLQFGKAGLPDIIGVMRDGKFLGLECKRPANPGHHPAGKLSEHQSLFLDGSKKSGAVCDVIYSIEDVTALFKKLSYLP